MARSKANENLHKLSPILYDTLVQLELMPYRAFATPKDVKAALHGVDCLLIDGTERAYHRSTDEAKQRAHYSSGTPSSSMFGMFCGDGRQKYGMMRWYLPAGSSADAPGRHGRGARGHGGAR